MTLIPMAVRTQNISLDQKITIEITQQSLEHALTEISKEANVEFSFSSKQIPLETQISLNLDDQPLHQVLDHLFEDLAIEYLLVQDKVVLKKSKNTTSEKTKYTISGNVTDVQNSESLIGATVRIRSTTNGTLANAYGFYSLTLDPGKYLIDFSFVGYETKTIEASLFADTRMNIALSEDFSVLEEVIVRPSDSIERNTEIHQNATVIAPEMVSLKTAALGESDLVKSLDAIPGVQLFRDGSTFFNVRGGDRDQNQILVDEAPIYNPAHFMGLFSSFRPEAINDMKLYKGNLPPRMGGRISSVLDIKTREGNMNRYGIEGSMGLISGRLSLEGPIIKERSSFFVSGRRSFIGTILRANDPTISSFYFSDFNAKVNFTINRNNRIYLSGFNSQDEFLGSGGVGWNNNAGTIRWNHIFGQRLFSNTTFYVSRYNYNLVGDADFTWKNHVANATVKTDFSFYRDPSNTINFGFKLSGHNFNPGNIEDSTGAIPAGYEFVPKRNATEFTLYTGQEKNLNDQWTINYGLRLSRWTNFGRTVEYEIDDNYNVIGDTTFTERVPYNNYGNLEPRLGVYFHPNAKNTLKLTYGRNAQYMSLISNSISPFNNLEVWLPASVNIRPQTSNQIVLGWFRKGNSFQLDMEAYYKAMQNQIDYSNQSQLLLNPRMEAELRRGTGEAYGIETTLTKVSGKLTGWVSYAFGRSFRTIETINNGQKYPTLWDRPHQFVVNGLFDFNKRLSLAGTFYLSSGAAITSPTAFYEYNGRIVPLYEEVNNSRLPTYHRFDCSLRYELNRLERRFQHAVTFSLFNLYGQENTILKSYNKIESEDGIFQVPSNTIDNREITPTKIFVYRVVPSLTYSFKI